MSEPGSGLDPLPGMVRPDRINVMTTVRKRRLVSVEDYLAGEEISPIKHEYIGGVLYAMVGARNRHNLIASNILIALGVRLRGKPCRAFNSDTKVRLQFPTHVRFYYPDVSVVCRQNDQDDPYQDAPAVIFEVLSRGSRRTDEGEKKDAYLSIPSLALHALVEQNSASMVVHRRTEHGFVCEVLEGMDASLTLEGPGVVLPFSEVFEGVEFPGEPEADEDQD